MQQSHEQTPTYLQQLVCDGKFEQGDLPALRRISNRIQTKFTDIASRIFIINLSENHISPIKENVEIYVNAIKIFTQSKLTFNEFLESFKSIIVPYFRENNLSSINELPELANCIVSIIEELKPGKHNELHFNKIRAFKNLFIFSTEK